MPRNPLIAVQTQRESLRDVERSKLGTLLREDQELSEALDKILADQSDQLAEVAGLAEPGRVDINAVAARRYYATQLRSEAIRITASRQELATRITAQRNALAQADASVKAVEKLIEKQIEQARIEAARRTQLQIEDQWAASHAAK